MTSKSWPVLRYMRAAPRLRVSARSSRRRVPGPVGHSAPAPSMAPSAKCLVASADGQVTDQGLGRLAVVVALVDRGSPLGGREPVEKAGDGPVLIAQDVEGVAPVAVPGTSLRRRVRRGPHPGAGSATPPTGS